MFLSNILYISILGYVGLWIMISQTYIIDTF